jgi:hypothetical protein
MSAADAVAVGSIAHVLKTTFKELYVKIPEPPEEVEEVEEESPTENPVEVEYDEDGNPIERLDEDGNPIQAGVGADEENPGDGEADAEDDGDEDEVDNELEQSEEPEEEAIDEDDLSDEVDNEAHVGEGAIKIDQIEAELQQQLEQSNGLVMYLMDQHDKAHEEDKVEALRLKDEGLLVKAEIPIGPSFLLLDQSIMDQFGHFGSNLVSARGLLQDNLDAILEKSGNGPKKETQTVRYIEETPGYLKNTGSNAIRTQILQKVSTSTGAFTPGPASLSNRTVDYSKARLERARKRMKGKAGEPSMTAEELDVNLKVLERMNNRLQFLRNPRHDDKNPNSAGNKTLLNNPDNIATRPSGPGEHGHFLAVPPKVEFTEYETGVVYEQAILIRNVSQVSRRF